jgi:hypothetical protein
VTASRSLSKASGPLGRMETVTETTRRSLETAAYLARD